MRIAFILRESGPDAPNLSAVTAEIIAHLHAKGARVDLVVPEERALDVAYVEPAFDLYVLKSKSPMALSLAGALTAAGAGARVLNSFESSSLARDKIAATAVLAGSGVPVPPSWATGRVAGFRPLLEEGPLWLKPQRGSKGMGVRRIGDLRELDGRHGACTDPFGLPVPVFAQRDVPTQGQDLKVYVVGERVWAITRPFPARRAQDKMGRTAHLPPKIRAAALACGRALGLELYGVDFLLAGDRFHAVDVNAFPGYKGVAEAPRCLAEYIFERAVRACARAFREDLRDAQRLGSLGQGAWPQ